MSYITENRKNIDLDQIEDEVTNGGLEGTRRAISFLQSFVDGSSNSSDGFISKLSDGDRKKIADTLKSANTLFKSISQRALNMIATNETYRKQIREFKKLHGHHNKEIPDTKKFVAALILHVEDTLNKSIISSKKSDTRQKRLLEKKIVMTFYKTNKDELKKIFDLQNMLIKIKNTIEKP